MRINIIENTLGTFSIFIINKIILKYITVLYSIFSIVIHYKYDKNHKLNACFQGDFKNIDEAI